MDTQDTQNTQDVQDTRDTQDTQSVVEKIEELFTTEDYNLVLKEVEAISPQDRALELWIIFIKSKLATGQVEKALVTLEEAKAFFSGDELEDIDGEVVNTHNMCQRAVEEIRAGQHDTEAITYLKHNIQKLFKHQVFDRTIEVLGRACSR